MDTLFIEIIEAISAAAFLAREEKLPYVRLAARKVDTLKLLCMILWETKSLDIKKYIALSEVLDEVGKMLGGWNGQLSKTRPRRSGVRNEKSCVNRRGVVVVPVVVEPVEVRVPPVAVPDEVTDVEVAVPVAVMCKMPPIPLPIESLTGTVHSLDIYFDFVS